MATQEQLESFQRFASEQIRKGAKALSLGELVDLWEVQNLPADELAENVAAIQASLADMNRGETGRDAGDVVRELRRYSAEAPGLMRMLDRSHRGETPPP